MYDIIVIGGGPAGFTAGIYCKRAGKSVLVIESDVFGGQIVTSPKIENYPAIASISGYEFATHLINQAMELGVEIEIDKITGINDGTTKKVIGENKTYDCKAIIIATGAKNRKLNLPNEDKLIGKGVSYCAICDGPFYANKIVAVNGGGNSAVEEAIFLAEKCSTVYLIHRRNEFRAEKALVEQLKKFPNIKLVLSSTIATLNGTDELTSLTINTNGVLSDLKVDGLFVSIGKIPDSACTSNIVTVDNGGYIVASEDCKTNINGIFVAGDCRTKNVRQLTTAVSDGAIAGLGAVDYINSL